MMALDRSEKLDAAIGRALIKSARLRTVVSYVGDWPDLPSRVERVSDIQGHPLCQRLVRRSA